MDRLLIGSEMSNKNRIFQPEQNWTTEKDVESRWAYL